MKLQLIEWLDHSSFSLNVWREEDEYTQSRPLVVRTVGWVLKENKDIVTLVATHAEQSRFLGDMTILKKAIVKRYSLKEPK